MLPLKGRERGQNFLTKFADTYPQEARLAMGRRAGKTRQTFFMAALFVLGTVASAAAAPHGESLVGRPMPSPRRCPVRKISRMARRSRSATAGPSTATRWSPRRAATGGCGLSLPGLDPRAVSLPDIWGPALTTDVSTGHGVATYCRDIVLPNTSQFLALSMGTTRSVYDIHAVSKGRHGELKLTLLHRNGNPAAAEHMVPVNPTAPVIALPHDLREFRLVVHLANYVHKQGGIVDVPEIGFLQKMESMQRRASAFPTALTLVLLLAAGAAIAVGRGAGNSRGHFIFAALCAASALRVFLVSNLVWDYLPAFPEARKYDLEYFSLFLIAPAYYAFICYLFRDGKVIWLDRFIYAVSAAFCLFALFGAPFFAPGTITLLREPFQALWALIILAVGGMILRTIFTDIEARRDALIVLLAAAVYFVYEILTSMKIVGASMELSSNLVIVFVTALHIRAFVLKFRRVEGERDALHRNLLETNEALEARADELSHALGLAEAGERAPSPPSSPP